MYIYIYIYMYESKGDVQCLAQVLSFVRSAADGTE